MELKRADFLLDYWGFVRFYDSLKVYLCELSHVLSLWILVNLPEDDCLASVYSKYI